MSSAAQITPLHIRLENLMREQAPAQGQIRALIDEADAEGSADVAALACHLLAYRMGLDGSFVVALELYAETALRFDALGDSDRAAEARAKRAEILAELGRQDEALTELASVLPAAARIADPWQRYSTYWVAANAVASLAPMTAYALWSEAAGACPEMPERPLCAVDARLRLARRVSNPVQAAGELTAARRDLLRFPDSPDRKRTELDLTMAEAEWLLRQEQPSDRDLDAASYLYSEVIQGLGALGSPASVAEAQAARAEALTRLGLGDEARAELEASLRSLRKWDDDERFQPDAAEAGTPGALRDVFEKLIRLHLAESGSTASQSAFLLAEEMRDRLAPRLNRRFRAMAEEEIASAVESLPPGSVAVEFVVLGPTQKDEPLAVAWVLAEGTLQQVVLRHAASLEAPLKEARLAARARNLDAWKRATAKLWQSVISPLLQVVPSDTRRLILVPDSELFGVPFRSLWNPETGLYLDESFELALAPSLHSLVSATSAGERREARGPVLAIGFEDFETLGLGALGKSWAEKNAVLSVYRKHARAECEVTDWPSLRRCLPQAGVIHLATHAAADSQRPSWSWLALPRETVSLEQLWRELPPLPLRPLVVLSACESVATPRGGEGLGGLARPFLARGARAVVGTLWPIEDVEAATYFPLFHQAYLETGDEAEALQRARGVLPDWRDRPWSWGAVEVIRNGQ